MPTKTPMIAGLVCTALVASSATAAQVIGHVKKTSGTVFVVSGGVDTPARPGMPVKLADTLRTEDDGSIGVTLRDNSRVSLGPQSEMAMQKFRFEPARRDFSFLGRVIKGSLVYVSGLIAKLAPESAAVQTPTATIGIRGTRFLLKVEDE